MTKHEKHGHAAQAHHEQRPEAPKEEAAYDPLDDLEGSEDLLRSSFAAGNEMKIAIGMILVLVVIFAAVLVKSMRHRSAPAASPADETVAQNEDKKDAAGDKEADARREKSPFASAGWPSKATTATAEPDPSMDLRAKPPTNDRGGWGGFFDTKKPAKTPGEPEPLKPFGPRIPPSDTASGRSFSSVPKSTGSKNAGLSSGGWESDTSSALQTSTKQPGGPNETVGRIGNPSYGQRIGNPSYKRPVVSGALDVKQPDDPFRSRAAPDGLRGDKSGVAIAGPTFGESAINASRNIPQSVSRRAPNQSFGGVDNTRGTLRPGEPPTLPASSIGSRDPATKVGANPLRFSDFNNPVRNKDQDWPKNNFQTSEVSKTSEVFPANSRIRNEDKLRPGGLITAPKAADLEKRYPSLWPSSTQPNAAGTLPKSANSPSPSRGSRTYVVQPGDTIYDIAKQELGKAMRWREIYDLNRDIFGTQSLDLTPGTRIVLPDAASDAFSRRNDSGLRR